MPAPDSTRSPKGVTPRSPTAAGGQVESPTFYAVSTGQMRINISLFLYATPLSSKITSYGISDMEFSLYLPTPL